MCHIIIHSVTSSYLRAGHRQDVCVCLCLCACVCVCVCVCVSVCVYLSLASLLIDLRAGDRQVCTNENDDCCLSRKKRKKKGNQ